MALGLGKNLAAHRMRHGLSQQELADRLDVHQSTIGGIEAGHRKPSISLLLKLARYFNVSVEELATDNEAEPVAEPA